MKLRTICLPFLMATAFTLPSLAADVDEGAEIFKRRCSACHTVEEGGRDKTGPNLYGMFSRNAGKKDGYRYSKGLAEADYAWDDEKLQAWLEDPRKFSKGSKMVFKLRKDKDRDDVIAYLRAATQ